MAKINKYYAVRKGSVPGIYRSWEECQYSIKGFPGAEYKSFATEDEAKAFMSGNNMSITHTITEDDVAIAYTDGSFSTDKNQAGYGSIIITKTEQKELYGIAKINNKSYPNLRQIVGELVAVMETVNFCKKHGYKKLTIYYDYVGVLHWADKTWSANNEASIEYQRFMSECDIDVEFIKVPAHANNIYNEQADNAAKKGCTSKF